ncbi:IclR family transcriptional regulator [Rathayibacter soli]|uniref:IclR family transcriptional regulator n=1 Tax=Rathayibacter soli TaxID=3144168 RepID=UPI0027E4D7DB|nr:IclR family transcriptional regulator [Glaciibacter superstes]
MSIAPAISAAPAAKEPRVVRSLVHASGLLKALHKSGRPTSLSDLARKIQLSKPATYVLLQTLEAEGLIVKDEAARYTLGWGLYELGSAVIRPVDFARAARMQLDHLAQRTGEIVLLGILDRGSVLYLDRGEVDDNFAMIANVGRRSPLHTTASGKVLLAYQDAAYVNAHVRRPLRQATSQTITDPAALVNALHRVRARGYALCRQEQEIGLSSIAVPVFGPAGGVQAALAIATPASKFTFDALPRLLDELQKTSVLIAAVPAVAPVTPLVSD